MENWKNKKQKPSRNQENIRNRSHFITRFLRVLPVLCITFQMTALLRVTHRSTSKIYVNFSNPKIFTLTGWKFSSWLYTKKEESQELLPF
jgi:hypothetical protein